MRRHHTVVVGASLAGLRAVEGLRRRGYDGRITLIGEEAGLPYDRPPLSKDLLLGKAEADALTLTSQVALADLDVEYREGTRACGLDLDTRTVMTDQSALDRITFDALIIATGARARVPADFPRIDGVHSLRSLGDSVAIRTAFEQRARVVVLGGGFIGSEVASAARDLGLEVTVVDIAPALMLRGLGTTLGARMTAIAAEHGVGLRLGRSVTDVLGKDQIEAVRLNDGTVLEADLLVLGLGSAPNTEWLAGSGLDLNDGLVCDSAMQASEGIFAVGDVARWDHPIYGSVRCEHWTTAGEHADAVAATLTGSRTECAEIPYVWSDQFGNKIQIAGMPGADDEIEFVTDQPDRMLALTGRNGLQRSAIALNAPGALIRQRMKLAACPPWPPAKG